MTLLGFIVWMMAGTMGKFTGKITDPSNSWAPFIRQIGIFALAVPLLWAVITIKKERTLTNRWTAKHSLVSGIANAYLMFYLLGKSMTYGRIEP